VAHVLVLSLVFPPDNVSTAVIMGELAADLETAGHEVTVVTTVPHYNPGERPEPRQPLARVWGPLLSTSRFEGIRVLHVGMPRKTASVPSRLLAWTRFHVVSLAAAAALVRRVDVILAPSPPLTIGVCAWVLGVLYRAPYVYNVQELYPDLAVALGAVKNRRLIDLLLWLERFVYAHAGAVTVIAGQMRRRLLEKGVAERKVHLIPNFVDVEDLVPLPRDNAFSREQDLGGAFVVTYAGNMGPAQGLETVVEAASLLKDEPGLVFLFVGDGGSRAGLAAAARERGLTNVRFVSYQPYGRVPQIYGASDVCLVALASRAGCDAIPSKVYRIMACARPVLACADADSDLAQLVTSVGCGTVVGPANPGALAQAVLHAKRNPSACRAQGESGRAHVAVHYARRVVSAQYDRLLRTLASPAGKVMGADA
jgi:colanic acid biosynthesis glycosyl transferase WcaI